MASLAASGSTKLESSISFPAGDDVGALVLDVGSLYVQAGYAGDEWPKHFSESFIGEQHNSATLSEAANGSTTESPDFDVQPFVARRPYKRPAHKFPLYFNTLRNHTEVRPCLYRSTLSPPQSLFPSTLVPRLDDVLASPSSDPLRLDKEVFETLLDRIFNSNEGLQVEIKERPVLITEPNVHNRSVREGMAEVLFETFEAEGVYSGKRAVLSTFSVGRFGGLVVDIGSATTVATSVIDGYTLRKHVKEVPIGGNLLDYQLLYLLQALGHQRSVVPIFAMKRHAKLVPNLPPIIESIESVSTTECHPSYYAHGKWCTIRTMKESICRIAEDSLPLPPSQTILPSGLPKHATTTTPLANKYELPDGISVGIEQIARTVPECLFNFNYMFGLHQDHMNQSHDPMGASSLPSSLLGATSLAHLTANCVNQCDVDSRRDLLQALIYTGGTTLLPGFGDRITRQLQDVEGLFGSGLKYKVVCPQSTVERRFSSWIGGSILASLGSFQQMWLSRSEYNEHGALILERKCVQ